MSRADEQEPFLSAAEEDELFAQLRAAARPGELDPQVHEQLLGAALDDSFAEPSEDERLEAQRLREALERGAPHPDAALLRALGAPFRAPVDEPARQATAPTRRNVVYFAFGAGSVVLAAAAALALLVGEPPTAPHGVAVAVTAPSLALPRSTADLFDARFETSGTSARMDRIANARGRELRDNRYAAWGVR